ncbi:hypothetical protein RhiirA4_477868 [Rhizophagus irregularis]|uniref:Uncharacterized protein n=1 Tax=Rhizophagus irregularis TaxID=588596 RepID=A0A2I1HDW2_9GLOM|nr:hypothetical protein RhiirA4_477868 [Rhizophagus irregularis]
MLLLFIPHILLIYFIKFAHAALYYSSIQESTIGLGILSENQPFPDNTNVLRLARVDPNNINCNEPAILFRSFIAGQTTISVLDLAEDGNARIPPDNFCKSPSPKKRKLYIFDDNYILHERRRIHKRSPPHDHHDHHDHDHHKHSHGHHKHGHGHHSDDHHPPHHTSHHPPHPSPKGAPSSPSAGPPDSKNPTPSSGKEPTTEPAPAPAPAPTPKAVNDKIKILTFYNEFVLIYYPCGVQVCGDIYSIKNIKNLVKSVSFTGNCDETSAVQGPDGFLYLCYHDVDSSISWESWKTNGIEFNKVYEGKISNVTVPNEIEAENFGGGLFKVFSTGPSKYSIVMGSFPGKPDPNSQIYNTPVQLFAYFITDVVIISGPFPIYQNGENFGGTIQFLIQVCNAEVGGEGYKCLISYRINETDSKTNFVAISFSANGEPTGTVQFEITGTKTPASLNLNYGGWCIGVVGLKGLDCLAYDEQGGYHGSWGIPVGDYSKVGNQPDNMMWAIPQFTNPLSWEIISTDQVTGFKPNVPNK